MSTTYAERLQDVMSKMEPPVDRKALAAAMGITVQALGNVLRGEVKKINYRQAAGAARFLGVELAWLVGEEPEMTRANASLLISTDDGAIPLPPSPRSFVDYRAVRMSALDYNKMLFDFRRSLPEQYRPSAGLTDGVPPHLRPVYFDYCSAHLRAMVIPVNGAAVGKSVSDSVLELVLASHADNNNNGELALLFIDPFASQAVKMPPAARDACDLLGIHIVQVKTPADAAKYITDTENAIKQYLADD